MRLATLDLEGSPTAAVLIDDGFAPIDGYGDVGALLRAGEVGLAAARQAAASEPRPLRPESVRRPVSDPGAVICVGLNYGAHIREMKRDLPDHPTLFAKHARALCDPYEEIELPPDSSQVDYEGELTVVIGRRARYVSEADAPEHIAGYTLMNDLSMRDFQYRTLQWFAGKTFERSTPVGPWIVTSDELPRLDSHELRVSVNGELRQRAQFDDLVFSPAALVADISRIMTLEPGDLIATGSPGGVGYAMDPPRFLASGDEVVIEVDGIGVLRNRFLAS